MGKQEQVYKWTCVGRKLTDCTTETGKGPGDQGVARVSCGCCIRRKQEKNEFKKGKFSICWQKAEFTSYLMACLHLVPENKGVSEQLGCAQVQV